MFLADRLELDIETRGYRVIAWISAALDLMNSFHTRLPASDPNVGEAAQKRMAVTEIKLIDLPPYDIRKMSFCLVCLEP